MCDSTYNIIGNNLTGNAIGNNATVIVSSQVQTPSLTNPEYKQILSALQGLKWSLDKNSSEYRKLLKIEECAKKHDSGGMRSAAMEFAKQFSSAALANMFSGSVLHLLGI
ncbi:MAG: hypothetical protein HDT15_09930 [Oscillibacter sp.]|nr:hypothetical protein [Oscillibacter sp.]MBD5155358.1 hypothetical protein [Oscillibacter sp.]